MTKRKYDGEERRNNPPRRRAGDSTGVIGWVKSNVGTVILLLGPMQLISIQRARKIYTFRPGFFKINVYFLAVYLVVMGCATTETHEKHQYNNDPFFQIFSPMCRMEFCPPKSSRS